MTSKTNSTFKYKVLDINLYKLCIKFIRFVVENITNIRYLWLMRSKKEKTATTDSNNKLKKNQRKLVTSKSSSIDYSSAFDISNLIVVGVIKADEHSRLTFTKRIKSVFPVFPGNTIVIYQNPVTNELLFKVQHN